MEKYTFASKIGTITLFYNNKNVERVFVDKHQISKDKPSSDILNMKRQFDDYLEGKRSKFNLPINIIGSTFNIDILNGILGIPIGKTMSYKVLANMCGYPNAYRAVGTVCKNNKLPIVIPCHRVIKSNGDIGEYVFGKKVKKQLLDLERSYIFY
ncbi:MAG: methylated-DNA--[protein]-cysteine S-methyltransferase [Tenericutes bacterium]|nr:methylated-DNA--[protein]-cysteine S-methyltransferase [Mycoplasmatota bacterium]